jgi:hypothetical protein
MIIKLRAFITTYFTYSKDLFPNKSGGPGGGEKPIKLIIIFNNY